MDPFLQTNIVSLCGYSLSLSCRPQRTSPCTYHFQNGAT